MEKAVTKEPRKTPAQRASWLENFMRVTPISKRPTAVKLFEQTLEEAESELRDEIGGLIKRVLDSSPDAETAVKRLRKVFK